MKAQESAGDDRAKRLKANEELDAYNTKLTNGEARKRSTIGNLLYEGVGDPHRNGKVHVKEL